MSQTILQYKAVSRSLSGFGNVNNKTDAARRQAVDFVRLPNRVTKALGSATTTGCRVNHTMLDLATILLRHTTRWGSHCDWFMENPLASDPRSAPLWAARADLPSECWATVGAWGLELLPLHRRRYMTYQGQIDAKRGQVRRIDQGRFVPLLWTDHRVVIDLAMHRFRGLVEIQRVTTKRWQVKCV